MSAVTPTVSGAVLPTAAAAPTTTAAPAPVAAQPAAAAAVPSGQAADGVDALDAAPYVLDANNWLGDMDQTYVAGAAAPVTGGGPVASTLGMTDMINDLATMASPAGVAPSAVATAPGMAGMVAQLTAMTNALAGITGALGASAVGTPVPGVDAGSAVSAPASAMPSMAGMDMSGATTGAATVAGGGMTSMAGMKLPANPGAIMPMGKAGMAMKLRSAPIDAAKAQRLATAVTSFFANVTKSQVTPGVNKTDQHFHIPKAMQQHFERQNPGLKSPTTLVFDKKTNRPFGVMYMGDKQGGPNLPMGNSHRHHPDTAFMEHIWFTPNDLGLAYGDIQKEDAARKAVLG